MNDSRKISRRDWFRLRIPPQNKSLSDPHVDSPSEPPSEQASSGATAKTRGDLAESGLKPIPQPPNHDGLDLSKLPPMREAILSIEDVGSLFTDIKKLATDVQLMQRSTAQSRTDVRQANADTKLELAHASLINGTIQRVQIRYRWKDSFWIDTLKAEPDGFHIVRIAHPSQ